MTPLCPDGKTMFNECRHIMPSGAKCKSPALKNQSFCYFHARLRPAASTRPVGQPPLDLPPLEDPQGIQIALSQVLAALRSPYFDNKRAGLYLYGLQIATQLAGRASVPPTSDLVRSLSSDAENGETLAPETSQCDPGADCDSCATRDECVLPLRIAYVAARQFYTEALKKLREREQREIEGGQEISFAQKWASELEWQSHPDPHGDEGDEKD